MQHPQVGYLGVDLGEVSQDQVIHDSLVHQSPHHLGVVVVGQEPLADGHEEPEGLLLTAVDQQDAGHDVHGLAVANLGIPVGVGSQDSPQCCDPSLVAGLEGWMFRQGPVEISFNLFIGQTLSVDGHTGEFLIISWVSLHVKHSSGECHPDLSPPLVGDTLHDQV